VERAYMVGMAKAFFKKAFFDAADLGNFSRPAEKK